MTELDGSSSTHIEFGDSIELRSASKGKSVSKQFSQVGDYVVVAFASSASSVKKTSSASDTSALDTHPITILPKEGFLLITRAFHAKNWTKRQSQMQLPRDNLPIILAGGGFQHGQYLAHDAKDNAPLCNLFVAILRRHGLDVSSFASRPICPDCNDCSG